MQNNTSYNYNLLPFFYTITNQPARRRKQEINFLDPPLAAIYENGNEIRLQIANFHKDQFYMTITTDLSLGGFVDKKKVEMKKKKYVGIAALLPLALFKLTALPVSAEVTGYQEADTSTEETSAECQVIYKSTYDFSEEIPKYPELEVSSSGYEGVYDGKSHGITVDCKTDGATILYSTDGKTYTTSIIV